MVLAGGVSINDTENTVHRAANPVKATLFNDSICFHIPIIFNRPKATKINPMA